MALTMPAVSATGMAAVDRDRSGIASGVINANRQLGGALGIAVLGSVAATLTRDAWHEGLAQLPAVTRAAAEPLTGLVLGGQGGPIAALAGPQAQAAALEAFVHGVSGAMLISSALTLLARRWWPSSAYGDSPPRRRSSRPLKPMMAVNVEAPRSSKRPPAEVRGLKDAEILVPGRLESRHRLAGIRSLALATKTSDSVTPKLGGVRRHNQGHPGPVPQSARE